MHIDKIQGAMWTQSGNSDHGKGRLINATYLKRERVDTRVRKVASKLLSFLTLRKSYHLNLSLLKKGEDR